MLKVLAVLLFSFYFIMNAQAYKEAEYKLLSKDDHVEIRLYKKAYLAKYHSEGNRKSAGKKSFKTLYNYIKEGDIPMTTPVTLVEGKPNEWAMSFFMPSGKSIEDLPKPVNAKVKITELKERKIIAYKFRSSMNDDNFEKYNARLLQYIKENNLVIIDQAISAAYSSPFTPWFMKDSEIMYEFV